MVGSSTPQTQAEIPVLKLTELQYQSTESHTDEAALMLSALMVIRATQFSHPGVKEMFDRVIKCHQDFHLQFTMYANYIAAVIEWEDKLVLCSRIIDEKVSAVQAFLAANPDMETQPSVYKEYQTMVNALISDKNTFRYIQKKLEDAIQKSKPYAVKLTSLRDEFEETAALFFAAKEENHKDYHLLIRLSLPNTQPGGKREEGSFGLANLLEIYHEIISKRLYMHLFFDDKGKLARYNFAVSNVEDQVLEPIIQKVDDLVPALEEVSATGTILSFFGNRNAVNLQRFVPQLVTTDPQFVM